jgi:hypothetical protein
MLQGFVGWLGAAAQRFPIGPVGKILERERRDLVAAKLEAERAAHG